MSSIIDNPTASDAVIAADPATDQHRNAPRELVSAFSVEIAVARLKERSDLVARLTHGKSFYISFLQGRSFWAALTCVGGWSARVCILSLTWCRMRCGVATSTRMLVRRPGAANLLKRWTPADLVDELAAHIARESTTLINGIYIYPFGGLGASLDWLSGVDQQFESGGGREDRTAEPIETGRAL